MGKFVKLSEKEYKDRLFRTDHPAAVYIREKTDYFST